MTHPTRVLDFKDIAELLNYSRSTQIDLSPIESRANWARYSGKNTFRGASYPFNVIYLKANANQQDLAEAIKCSKRVPNAELVYAPSVRLPDLKNGALTDQIKSLDTKAYLASFIQEELKSYLSQIKEDKPKLYIAPNIQTPSGFAKKVPNPLLSFLLDSSLGGGLSDGCVAVVLAEAGQGKTYMCSHLAATVAERNSEVIPILIASSQWKNMPLADQRSLPKTILNCLSHYRCPVPWLAGHEEEFVAIALKLDLFKIIFDGFDEYLLSNRDVHQEEDVIDAIRNLAEENNARIIVTSRTSYWKASIDDEKKSELQAASNCVFYDMVPFEEEHAQNYFKQRFVNSADKISSAARLFQNLAKTAKDLVGRGFALNLIADVIDRGQDTNVSRILSPIDWLIRELCTRDRMRQELPFDADQQFLILRTFAEEVAHGAAPTSELLDLCMENTAPSLDSRSRERAIQGMTSHPVLQLDGKSSIWKFREEQVRVYLLAHFLAKERQGRRVADWDLAPGELQDLLQTVVEILSCCNKIEEIESGTSEIINSLRENGATKLAGLLVLGALEKVAPKSANYSHSDRFEHLKKLCGAPIKNIHFSGTINALNFSGAEFENCVFDHVTFINCEFNSDTCFTRCIFTGGSSPIRSNSLGEAVFGQGTTFDPGAQRWIDQVRVLSGKRHYKEEDLRSDIGILLDRFLNKGRVMVRSVQKSNLTRGAIRSSKHADLIIEEFRKMLLEPHHVSSVSEPGYNIRPEFKNDVIFFGQNNSFTGQVHRLFTSLRDKLVDRKTS